MIILLSHYTTNRFLYFGKQSFRIQLRRRLADDDENIAIRNIYRIFNFSDCGKNYSSYAIPVDGFFRDAFFQNHSEAGIWESARKNFNQKMRKMKLFSFFPDC